MAVAISAAAMMDAVAGFDPIEVRLLDCNGAPLTDWGRGAVGRAGESAAELTASFAGGGLAEARLVEMRAGCGVWRRPAQSPGPMDPGDTLTVSATFFLSLG